MGGRCPGAPSSHSSDPQLPLPARRPQRRPLEPFVFHSTCRAGDVLSARAGLSEVRWALVDAAPRRALRGALQGLLQDGAELRACRLRRVKLKPGRKLTVHYDTWVRAGGTEIKRP